MRRQFQHAKPYTDRHGKRRWRYRKAGFSVELGRVYGSDEFIRRYELAEQGRPIGASKSPAGTLNALASAFYASAHYTGLKSSTKAVYRRIIENLKEKHGKKRITESQFRRRHVIQILAEKADTPHAANRLRSVIGLLMQCAIDLEWRETNPIITVKKFKTPPGGYYTWTEADISRFMEVHGVGTLARRVMVLMLFAAAGRSDAVRLGRQNIKNGRIEYHRQKQETRGGQRINIPILPKLQTVIDEVPSGHMTFLQTRQGKSRSPNGLGNLMRKWCDQAGLPECTSHGLRKAQARRLAEAGCTHKQSMAWLGHATESESAKYSKDADINRLTDAAADHLEGEKGEQKVVNHPKRFT